MAFQPASPARGFFAAAALVLAASAVCLGASLTWGPSAAGGVGNWDANVIANWFDGTTTVKWPAPGGSDDDAVFSGIAGLIIRVLAHGLEPETWVFRL